MPAKPDLMNKIIENLILGIIAAAIFAGLPTLVTAQIPKPAPMASPGTPPRRPEPSVRPAPARYPSYTGGETSEKSIKVDNSVNINLCILQGSVKVNGWKRSEIRVFVSEGTKFGFRVQETNQKSGDPGLVSIEQAVSKNKNASTGVCLWGDEIEIDVPVNATVNIKGTEITTAVDSIKKVSVKTAGGDVSLRNISASITVNSGQGDITVEESKGAMDLGTTNGSILVFEAGPGEIGDMFRAHTNNGSIALQGLQFRQVEVTSISGSVAYTGEILGGGSYNFNTNRGSIRLAIPADSSCQVNATFRAGSFHSDLPFKVLTENITEGSVKNVVSSIGKGGDATLKLTTVNGNINIKKQ